MHFIHKVIETRPDSDVALIVDGESVDFGLLKRRANASAAWLLSRDIRKGDLVVVSLSDPRLQLYATLGLMKIGAVQSPIDPRSMPATFDKLVQKLRARFLLSDEPQLRRDGIEFLAPPALEDLDAFIISEPLPENVSLDDLALLCHGSGTTGEPKLLPIKHRHLTARCENFPEQMSSGERSLILQRHTSLTFITRALHCLYWGGCLVEVTRMRTGAPNYWELLCETIEKYGVDHLHCTVFHAKALLASAPAAAEVVRFPRLKSMLVGASPISKTLREHIRKRITPNLRINYGTNEVGFVLRTSPELLTQHPESIGVPGQLTEIAVVGPKGQFLEPGQTGMLAVRGKSVIDGYADNADETRKAFVNGWFLTGDLGYKSADGAFFFLSRADDMMLIAGFNVYPIEIEQVIEAIPEVQEVAVAMAYSDLGHDVLVAFVVAGKHLGENYIIQVCHATLGWKAPQKVFFVPSLPRNATGKLLRRELPKLLRKA